uniref:(northern house mosquito) hypothetical protein n=1 Tax=Culex pipiens TaxID=7175 RepID=A0A8D8CXC8_CULPI
MQLLHVLEFQLFVVAHFLPEELVLLPSLLSIRLFVITEIILQHCPPCCILLLQNRSTLLVEPIVPSSSFHKSDGAFRCVGYGCLDAPPAVLEGSFQQLTLPWQRSLQRMRVPGCDFR